MSADAPGWRRLRSRCASATGRRAASDTGVECSARRRTSRQETPSFTSAGTPVALAVANSTAWRMIP